MIEQAASELQALYSVRADQMRSSDSFGLLNGEVLTESSDTYRDGSKGRGSMIVRSSSRIPALHVNKSDTDLQNCCQIWRCQRRCRDLQTDVFKFKVHVEYLSLAPPKRSKTGQALKASVITQ